MTQTRQKSSDRRKEIERAVRKLIVEKGLEGLRTRDVAAEVGINISTLHYHIPTKDALIEFVAQSIIDDLVEHGLASSHDELTPPESLKHNLELQWAFNENYPDMKYLFHELNAMSVRDKTVAKTLDDMRNKWRDVILKILERGKNEEFFRSSLDCEAYAQIVISTVMNFWKIPEFNRNKFDRICSELINSILAKK